MAMLNPIRIETMDSRLNRHAELKAQFNELGVFKSLTQLGADSAAKMPLQIIIRQREDWGMADSIVS